MPVIVAVLEGEVQGWLRLYPAAWRERYGDEVAALLADIPPTLRGRLDLWRGAIDAHLHPLRAPGWPVAAAAIGGIGWTSAAAFAVGQPVPPDWPGYLAETLPLFLIVVPLLGLAILGASTRLGDLDPPAARLGRVVAVAGAVTWTVLLAAAVANLGSGAPLAAAAQVTGAGTFLVGLALLRDGDAAVALGLVLASVCLFVPLPLAAVAHGGLWAAIAAAMLVAPRPDERRRPGRAA